MTPHGMMTQQQLFEQQQQLQQSPDPVQQFRYQLQQGLREVMAAYEGGAFAAPGAAPPGSPLLVPNTSSCLCPESPALLAPLTSAPSLSAATGSAAIVHPSNQGLGGDPTCLSAAATPALQGHRMPPPGMIDVATGLHHHQQGYLMQQGGVPSTPPSVPPFHAQMLGLLPSGGMPLMTLHQHQIASQVASQMAMTAASAAAAFQQSLMAPSPQPSAH
jgi:hypothetical protein